MDNRAKHRNKKRCKLNLSLDVRWGDIDIWYDSRQIIYWPIDAEDDQEEGGEDVAPGSEHHQQLAHDVPGVPLYGQPQDMGR